MSSEVNYKFVPLFHSQIDYIITSDLAEVIHHSLSLPEESIDWRFIDAALIVLEYYLKEKEMEEIVNLVESHRKK